jgi:hypothetical protein
MNINTRELTLTHCARVPNKSEEGNGKFGLNDQKLTYTPLSAPIISVNS